MRARPERHIRDLSPLIHLAWQVRVLNKPLRQPLVRVRVQRGIVVGEVGGDADNCILRDDDTVGKGHGAVGETEHVDAGVVAARLAEGGLQDGGFKVVVEDGGAGGDGGVEFGAEGGETSGGFEKLFRG